MRLNTSNQWINASGGSENLVVVDHMISRLLNVVDPVQACILNI